MNIRKLWNAHTSPDAVPIYYANKTIHKGYYEKRQMLLGYSDHVHMIDNIDYLREDFPTLMKQVLVRFI